jgi:hypothetical protein
MSGCSIDLAAVMNDTRRRDSRYTSDISSSGSRNCGFQLALGARTVFLGTCLIVMGCADDEHCAFARDIVRPTRAYFTKENIGRNTPDKQHDIVGNVGRHIE